MTRDISNYRKMCQKCQKSNTTKHTKTALTIRETPTNGFDRVIVAIVSTPKSEQGKECAVTIIRDLTKYLVAIPSPNKSAKTVQ